MEIATTGWCLLAEQKRVPVRERHSSRTLVQQLPAVAHPKLPKMAQFEIAASTRVMTGAKKGVPAVRKFWDHLAWSRVVAWGRDLCGVHEYFEKNRADAFV